MDAASATYNGENGHWLLQGLQELYRDKKHCDIEIHVQKKVFQCHRVVLSAASGYFDAMFTSGMRESKTGIVEITDVNSVVFSDILDFIYHGTNTISTENVEDILYGACRLQINTLIQECQDFLHKQISAENCIGIWIIARSLACLYLQDEALSFIINNFDDVIAHDEFLKLEKADMISLIKDDNLRTRSENNVCIAALRWIASNESNRKNNIVDIFSEIRFCQVDLEFLLTEIFTNPIVYLDKACMSLLTKAVKYHALPDRRHASKSLTARPRNTSNTCSLLVVIGRRHSTYGPDVTEIMGYSAKDGKWYTLCYMPLELGEDFAVCPYGNDIFVSGGTIKCEAFLRFSAKQYKWLEKPAMTQGRYRHNLVAVADSIYAVGGYNFGTLGNIEEYDISAGSWQSVGELKHAVDAATASVHGRNIYVFGGWCGLAEVVPTVQCFNTDTNQSTVVCSLPSPHKDARAISTNNTTYIVCKNGEVFSFKEESLLKRIETLGDFNRKYFGVYKEGKTLMILGGENVNDTIDHEQASFHDDIRIIKEQGSNLNLPGSLPIPMQVIGCCQTLIKLKYPLVEFSEQLSFTC